MDVSATFHINPIYHSSGLTLNISETDSSLDLDLDRSVAKYFMFTDYKAMDQMAAAIKKHAT